MKTAKAGEKITAKAAANLRKSFGAVFSHVLSTPEGCTIQPKTDAKDGQWICVDCGEPFQNNMMAHNHTKSHRLAWWTGLHFEEP